MCLIVVWTFRPFLSGDPGVLSLLVKTHSPLADADQSASSRQSRVHQLGLNRRGAGAQPSTIDDQTAGALA
jgi:hypothetical protein